MLILSFIVSCNLFIISWSGSEAHVFTLDLLNHGQKLAVDPIGVLRQEALQIGANEDHPAVPVVRRQEPALRQGRQVGAAREAPLPCRRFMYTASSTRDRISFATLIH